MILPINAAFAIFGSQFAVTLIVLQLYLLFYYKESIEDTISLLERIDFSGKVERLPLTSMFVFVPLQVIAILILFIGNENVDQENLNQVRQVEFAVLLIGFISMFILTRQKSISSTKSWFRMISIMLILWALVVLFQPETLDNWNNSLAEKYGFQELGTILTFFLPLSIASGLEMGMLFNQHYTETKPQIGKIRPRETPASDLYPELD
jgi:hypothetical protein